ncbi:GFA family protein [Phenylobacterium sp.]|uniref:GFA family protein n=1 Tax=Phenylobacterium sp. TaxID=1871053 RepID=UPI0027323FDC|nr:GFA family protein [Phenylobacterium sp.]MDP3852164.1 GFA family protein [Phenylobacterium sp.]
MIKGGCHCKATQFEVASTPKDVNCCNCSLCSKRGALWAYYDEADFRLVTARERISTYQTGDYWMKQHFCAICGCATFNEGPGWKDGEVDFTVNRISVNARLFDDYDLAQIPVRYSDNR